jgi:UDP-glucose 4-epimerase
LVEGKRERVHPEARLHELDIRDLDAITPVFSGVDCVFHLAALPSVGYSIDNPRESHDVNATGTLHVLEAAKAGGAKRVVYSASCAAYGNQKEVPFRESFLVNPGSPYAIQKYVGEHYARVYAELHDLPTVVLRYFNVYGPHQNATGPYASVLGKFLVSKQEGKPLPVTGDGEQTRDFVHVSDVVAANILAAESDRVGKGEVFNIGSGVGITINALAALFGGPVAYIPAREEIRDALADSLRAKEVLGWEPRVVFSEGIAELLRLNGF